VLRLLQGRKGEAIADQRAVTAISGLNFDLKSGQQALEHHIPNIGHGIAKHIDEILAAKKSSRKADLKGKVGTGIEELDEADPEMLAAVDSICDLMRISGISFRKAKNLFDHDVKSVSDLPPGELTHREQIHLKHIDELGKRIPRYKIDSFSRKFATALTHFNSRHKSFLQFTIAGSFRRGRDEAKDIDILLFSQVRETLNAHFIFRMTLMYSICAMDLLKI
jgi:DNA polymerase/3'-5' exonuclease PolX